MSIEGAIEHTHGGIENCDHQETRDGLFRALAEDRPDAQALALIVIAEYLHDIARDLNEMAYPEKLDG